MSLITVKNQKEGDLICCQKDLSTYYEYKV
jgi:hypothetical protein